MLLRFVRHVSSLIKAHIDGKENQKQRQPIMRKEEGVKTSSNTEKRYTNTGKLPKQLTQTAFCLSTLTLSFGTEIETSKWETRVERCAGRQMSIYCEIDKTYRHSVQSHISSPSFLSRREVRCRASGLHVRSPESGCNALRW